MAILIDMDMPTTCNDCKLFNSTPSGLYPYSCRVTWDKVEPFLKSRPNWCPIREVVMCWECESYIKSENKSEVWELCNHGMVSIHSVGGEEFCSRGKRNEE